MAGVPGVGKKGAVDLISAFGSLDALLEFGRVRHAGGRERVPHAGDERCLGAHDDEVGLVRGWVGDAEDLVDPRPVDVDRDPGQHAAPDAELPPESRDHDVVIRGVHAEDVQSQPLAGTGSHHRREQKPTK